MKSRYHILLALVLLAVGAPGWAQSAFSTSQQAQPQGLPGIPLFVADVNGFTTSLVDFSAVLPSSSAQSPLLSPDAALQALDSRWHYQATALAGYSDITVIEASLPDSSQRGSFELTRRYAAPRTLEFKPVNFTGDGFVKSNVILRMLTAEAEHVNKDDGAATAITEQNYKFSFKGTENEDGRAVYVYQVKPRHKRVNLFKGKIYVDACTGSMLRAEGSVVKTPSFFVRKVDFVQEFTEVNGFTLPSHLHSVSKVHIIGRTIVDVLHRDYRPVAGEATQASNGGGTGQ